MELVAAALALIPLSIFLVLLILARRRRRVEPAGGMGRRRGGGGRGYPSGDREPRGPLVPAGSASVARDIPRRRSPTDAVSRRYIEREERLPKAG